jgi:hypothetical protein
MEHTLQRTPFLCSSSYAAGNACYILFIYLPCHKKLIPDLRHKLNMLLILIFILNITSFKYVMHFLL